MLGYQRVVVGGDSVAVIEQGVHPHAGTAGEMQELRGPWAGTEVGCGIFSIDPALDGVPGEGYLFLSEGEGQAGGNAQLLPHQIQAGDHLGDRVLYLDAGVHLDEIELPLLVQHELDGARVLIACGPGGGRCCRAHRLPQLGGEGLGGGFLHQLLIFALDGTVPLPQVDHSSVAVGQDLKFDVLGIQDELLQIELSIAEAGQGFRPGLLEFGD